MIASHQFFTLHPIRNQPAFTTGALLRDPRGERLQIVRAKLKSLEQFEFSLSIGDLCARPEVDVPPSPLAARRESRSRSESLDQPLGEHDIFHCEGRLCK